MTGEAYQHKPYDIDVEQALLGAILYDNKTIEKLPSGLKADHFYDPLNGRIFDTITAMIERGGVVVTPLTLHATMKSDPGVLETGGQAYFEALRSAAPALPNMRDYATIMFDLAIRRGLISLAQDINLKAYEPPDVSTGRQQIETAEKALYGLSGAITYGGGALEFHEALTLTCQSAERAAARGGQISGVTTGFTDIDNLLGGLQPSDLLILAGRPGMGKTALATNMAFKAAKQYLQDIEANAELPRGAPILFFSLEMAAQQLAARVISEQTEIEMWKIRNGKFGDSEWEKFVLTMQDLGRLPLYIDDTGGISIAQIAARARRMKREKNIGVIVIDYLQLIEPSRRHENRVQEITEITKGLKALAKELNVPILALSQLSRGVDSRDDKRPVLADLRESGSIEQDADVVMFVYREEYYLLNREPAEVGSVEHKNWMQKLERYSRVAEVLVEKHRHGATKAIELFFEAKFTRFGNLSDRNNPP